MSAFAALYRACAARWAFNAARYCAWRDDELEDRRIGSEVTFPRAPSSSLVGGALPREACERGRSLGREELSWEVRACRMRWTS